MATATVYLIRKDIKQGDVVPWDATKTIRVKHVQTKSEARKIVKPHVPVGWAIMRVELSYGPLDPDVRNPKKMYRGMRPGPKHHPTTYPICPICGKEIKGNLFVDDNVTPWIYYHPRCIKKKRNPDSSLYESFHGNPTKEDAKPRKRFRRAVNPKTKIPGWLMLVLGSGLIYWIWKKSQ